MKREIIMVTIWPDTWGVFGQKRKKKRKVHIDDNIVYTKLFALAPEISVFNLNTFSFCKVFIIQKICL